MQIPYLLSMMFLFILAFPSWGNAGGGHEHANHDHGHGHGDSHDEHEVEKIGPHGGRLVEAGEFALEVKIFEEGVPPEYRVYPYFKGKALPAEEVQGRIELTRFGNKKDIHTLEPRQGYLGSSAEVYEPHSFVVDIQVSYRGENHAWRYESFEGRTTLNDAALKVARVELLEAGPHSIQNSTRVFGRLLADEDRVAHLTPRFPGVVKDIRKSLGDKVQKGETLAVIESNQNLQSYELKSQIEGVVIRRHATIGEAVDSSKEVFVVADLSQVWADFQVYRDDYGSIEVGQRITIDFENGTPPLPAKVSYVSPITDQVTQSKIIRAVLPNPHGELRPGLFISGTLVASEVPVPVAVKREAVQTFRDWQVVFLTDGHVFQAIPVTLGRRDSTHVEVLSGIAAGDSYVGANSFVIKADVEKSGASHDH